MERGTVWWAQLPEPIASEPGFRRPIIIIQSNELNGSRIETFVAVVFTSNFRLANALGTVLILPPDSALPKDSVANVSQIITLDRTFLTEKCGRMPSRIMKAVDDGIRLVLSL